MCPVADLADQHYVFAFFPFLPGRTNISQAKILCNLDPLHFYLLSQELC